MHTHKTIKKLEEELDLTHSCGYITLLRSGCLSAPPPLPSNQDTKAEGKDDEDAQNQLTASQLSEAADDEESPGLEEAVGGQAAESESLDIEKAKDLMQLPLETREVCIQNQGIIQANLHLNCSLLDLKGSNVYFINREL